MATVTIPPSHTEEYRWWREGANAEARAMSEGRSKAGLRVRDIVDALAEHHQEFDEIDIAVYVLHVHIAHLSRRERLRLAWKALR